MLNVFLCEQIFTHWYCVSNFIETKMLNNFNRYNIIIYIWFVRMDCKLYFSIMNIVIVFAPGRFAIDIQHEYMIVYFKILGFSLKLKIKYSNFNHIDRHNTRNFGNCFIKRNIKEQKLKLCYWVLEFFFIMTIIKLFQICIVLFN